MRPEERDGLVPFEPTLPTDPELEGLVAELEQAGARARLEGGVRFAEAPSAAFSARLREQLLSRLPTASPSTPAAQAPAPMTRPRRLDPRVTTRATTILPAPRWIAITVAAAVIVALVGAWGDPLLPSRPEARAADVSAATLIRDGAAVPLVAGAELAPGDEVRTASGGRAALTLAGSHVRLAAMTAIRIDRIAGGIRLDQVAGRAWHRVTDGTSYAVSTGTLTWTARGTAFDLERRLTATGELVTLRAIEHDVRLEAPLLAATVGEGRSAAVAIGDGGADVSTALLTLEDLSDPWLLQNAALDQALGEPVGIMESVLTARSSAAPGPTTRPLGSPAPAVTPQPAPTLSPEPAPSVAHTEPPVTPLPAAQTPVATRKPTPSPSLTPKPTPTQAPTPATSPTPAPTPTPTPSPTPSPGLPELAMTATACDGGVLLEWSAFGGPGFHHYSSYRSQSSSIAPTYPPPDGAVAVGTTYIKSAGSTTAYDASVTPGLTVHYRTMAFAADNTVLAASPVRTVTAKPVLALGTLSISTVDGGKTAFGWAPYGGSASCFSYYKLVYSPSDPSPSYLKGSPTLWAGSSQGDDRVTVASPSPGTYWFRLEVIRSTPAGSFVVARSDVVSFTVP